MEKLVRWECDCLAVQRVRGEFSKCIDQRVHSIPMRLTVLSMMVCSPGSSTGIHLPR